MIFSVLPVLVTFLMKTKQNSLQRKNWSRIILNKRLESFVMPLIIPGKPQIDFFLRTTKPFHNERAVKDFFQIVLSYGPDYRPVKYGRSEPVKELFDEKHLEKVASAWLGRQRKLVTPWRFS